MREDRERRQLLFWIYILEKRKGGFKAEKLVLERK